MPGVGAGDAVGESGGPRNAMFARRFAVAIGAAGFERERPDCIDLILAPESTQGQGDEFASSGKRRCRAGRRVVVALDKTCGRFFEGRQERIGREQIDAAAVDRKSRRVAKARERTHLGAGAVVLHGIPLGLFEKRGPVRGRCKQVLEAAELRAVLGLAGGALARDQRHRIETPQAPR